MGGHIRRSDDAQTRFGEELPSRCRCGAEFTTACTFCGKKITESAILYHKTGQKGGVVLPEYCICCGNPFPWTINSSQGRYFEALVLNLFPSCDFDLVGETAARIDPNCRKIVDAKNPDFQFFHKRSGHYFWVECKYRSKLFEGRIKWAEKWQMERYQQFQKSHRPEKIYVIIGLGGDAANPDSLYVIPLDEISYSGLYPVSIEKYKRSVEEGFDYQSGRLR